MTPDDPPGPIVSVPATARKAVSAPQHTAPLSVLIGALSGLQNAIVPAIFAVVSVGLSPRGLAIGLAVGAGITVLASLYAYIHWRRLTYTIGATDIRVESGVLSRAARSVPFERIQDVSLEQKLLPRLFGLVSVKFETGAGGGEDLSLAYLDEAAGEDLRRLVRERRDAHEHASSGADTGSSTQEPEGEPLFAMGPRRLFTFGLFEFSLAVFAVLGGLLQYVDSFTAFKVWDPDIWRDLLAEQSSMLAALGPSAKALSVIAGIIALVVIGSATGMARVFARDWNFLLERTPRGFRRRRGLFTRTDVVMPVHRVQAVEIHTRLIRRLFGWHGAKFVSLAQDAGSSSHVVAPFARIEEIAPIIAAAGFRLPGEDADWHRASRKYRFDSAAWDAALFLIAAIPVALFAPPWAIAIPLALAALFAGANLLAWRFHRHALDPDQVVTIRGVLAPRSQIATRLKLHSAQIVQGPLARLRGYATLNLGLAGGTFAIPGIPIERAREVRRAVIETIAATDFSRIEGAASEAGDQSARRSAQSGLASNFAAT